MQAAQMLSMLPADPLRREIAEHLDKLPHGWCRLEKANRLAELILEHRVTRAIEIGIFGGRSVAPMALAMRSQGFGYVIGLDPWDVAHALEGDNGEEQAKWWGELQFEPVRQSFIEYVEKAKLSPWLGWLQLGSVEAAPFFADESFDMIHLDGDHSEVTSCRDVGLWVKKLRPGGLFLLDDSNWPTQQKAVGILGREFKQLETAAFDDGQAYTVYQKPNNAILQRTERQYFRAP